MVFHSFRQWVDIFFLSFAVLTSSSLPVWSISNPAHRVSAQLGLVKILSLSSSFLRTVTPWLVGYRTTIPIARTHEPTEPDLHAAPTIECASSKGSPGTELRGVNPFRFPFRKMNWSRWMNSTACRGSTRTPSRTWHALRQAISLQTLVSPLQNPSAAAFHSFSPSAPPCREPGRATLSTSLPMPH